MRDALIEQLAAIAYANKATGGQRLGWAVASPHHKQECRDEVVREELPLIVEFVATWLCMNAEEYEDSADGTYGEVLAQAWREEIGMTEQTPTPGEAAKRYRLTDMGRRYLAMESAIEMALETLEASQGVEVRSLIRQQQEAVEILREGLAPIPPPEASDGA